MSVVWPTSTPATSVIALSGAGRAVERHAEIARPRRALGPTTAAAEARRERRTAARDAKMGASCVGV